MFVSRKKYIHALEQWNHWETLATKIQEDNRRLIDEMKETNEIDKRTVALAEEIHAYNKRLIAELNDVRTRLVAITRQRDDLEMECKALETDLWDAEAIADANERECAKLIEERDHFMDMYRHYKGLVDNEERADEEVDDSSVS